MKNKYTMAMVPESLAGFNAYDDENGNLLIGQTGEMTIATLTAITNEVQGAGIAGAYSAVSAGNFQAISQEIPFKAMIPQIAKYMNPMRRNAISVRGLMQILDRTTGIRDRVPFRFMVSGVGTAISPGTMQTGNPMGTTLTMDVTHILFVVGGETLFEIDKLNQVCIIDGEDILADVRKYC